MCMHNKVMVEQGQTEFEDFQDNDTTMKEDNTERWVWLLFWLILLGILCVLIGTVIK